MISGGDCLSFMDKNSKFVSFGSGVCSAGIFLRMAISTPSPGFLSEVVGRSFL